MAFPVKDMAHFLPLNLFQTSFWFC